MRVGNAAKLVLLYSMTTSLGLFAISYFHSSATFRRGARKRGAETGKGNDPLLVLFTTWVHSREKYSVHNNTLRNWPAWLPHIQPVLFTNETNLAREARQKRWHTLPLSKTTCGDVPILKSMFGVVLKTYRASLYGFANSDILFDDTLKETLESVANASGLLSTKPVFVTGRRTNVDFRNRSLITTVGDLGKLKGELARVWAEDYFFTNGQFPWTTIPTLVVGRPGIDNWLVLNSRAKKHHVIDATRTLRSFHQTTKDGNFAGSKRPKFDCNKKMLGKLKLDQMFRKGYADCISLETAHDHESKVVIIRRGIPSGCR